MPIPTPKKDEEKKEFIGRCISFIKKEDPNTPQDQATAICYSKWRKSKEENTKKELIKFLKKRK